MPPIAIVLIVLAAPQGPKEVRPLGREQRAEIVDRLMAEPFVARPRLAPVPAPDPEPVPVLPAPPDRERFVVRGGLFVRAGQPIKLDQPLVMLREPIMTAPPADLDEESADDRPPDPHQLPGRQITKIAEENFERWIFGEVPIEARHAQLTVLLAAKVGRAAEAGRLTSAQADKLRLAGRGDIKRFFEEVDGRRAGFDAARSDLARGVTYLNGLKPLTTSFGLGPFGEGSLVVKTLAKIEGDRNASQPGRPVD